MIEPDLKAKIAAIRDTGVTYTDIAARAGCDTSTLSRIRHGQIQDPSYSIGRSIDLLYAEVAKTRRHAAA